MTDRYGERPDTPADRPAPTITSKARSDVWVVDRRTRSKAAGGGMTDTVPVPMDRPAPTLTGKAGGQWLLRRRATATKGARGGDTVRSDEQPAPPLAFGHNAAAWAWERPATAVCADPRLSPPGYRGRPEDYDDDGTYLGERSMDQAIRLEVHEALTLQSFRPDYPVQGTRTKQFEQIGNAIPPGLATAILAPILGATDDH